MLGGPWVCYKNKHLSFIWGILLIMWYNDCSIRMFQWSQCMLTLNRHYSSSIVHFHLSTVTALRKSKGNLSLLIIKTLTPEIILFWANVMVWCICKQILAQETWTHHQLLNITASYYWLAKISFSLTTPNSSQVRRHS